MKKEYEPYSRTIQELIESFINDGPAMIIISNGKTASIYENDEIDGISSMMLNLKVESYHFTYEPKGKFSTLILNI